MPKRQPQEAATGSESNVCLNCGEKIYRWTYETRIPGKWLHFATLSTFCYQDQATPRD